MSNMFEVTNVPILQGIINVLKFLNENWTAIIIAGAVILTLIKKLEEYKNLSKNEVINKAVENALMIIKEVMTEKVSIAEIEWSEYKKTGSIKRSKVISEIYKEFPILTEYINQEELISKLDTLIDEALVEMRSAINNVTIKEVKEATSQ